MRSFRPHSLPVLAALLAALVACREPTGPIWVHLAEGAYADSFGEGVVWRTRGESGRELRLADREGRGGVWIEERILADEWTTTPLPGVWRTTRTVGSLGVPEDGTESFRLRSDDRSFAYKAFPGSRQGFTAADVEPGVFTVLADLVYLALEPDERPEDALLGVFCPRSEPENGRGRVGIKRFAGEGLQVWSGRPKSIVCEVPPDSVLRFATVSASIAFDPERDPGSVEFFVRVNGKAVHEEKRTLTGSPRSERHEVVLPADGAKRVRIELEARGAPAATAFVAPIIGPREVGDYDERPWDEGDEARPDVVLFLVDTFRADNMETYGGEPGLTPNLDAFARTCLLFERAWSPSSWTLPSQASMMTGLFPTQHGATLFHRLIPRSFDTIAERLAAAGYRTGAITDAIFVSRHFGFDQGFEWFDEHGATFESTLERTAEFLDADDGRPLFLFVHTYRVHSPYRVSEETRKALADRFPLQGDWAELFQAITKNEWEAGEPLPPELVRPVEELLGLYRGGVVDFDRSFASFLDTLRARDLLEQGWLLFTSDHGEAFAEHDALGHHNGVWEEHIRIPLLIRGPSVRPASVPYGASLLDLPHTLAHIAGIPPDPSWRGRSLLDLDEDRPVFSFESAWHRDSSLAIMDGPMKVIATGTPEGIAAGAILHAYDLGEDSRERVDLGSERSRKDAAAVLARNRARIEELLRPLVEPEEVQLSEEHREQLSRMGYVDH